MEKPHWRTKDEAKKKAYNDWCEDEKVRKLIEQEIQEVVNEAIAWNLKNYQFYAAVDLAWDTPAVSKSAIPLLLYAQGKINIQACASQLKALNCASEFVKTDNDGQPVSIDMPKFIDVSINMVRSYVTRRHAAQSVKYSNLYPYYEYESRSTGQVGKLRADAMSQEAEIQVDAFGLRHHDSQVMRDAFLYGHSIDFVNCAWEVSRQYDWDGSEIDITTDENGNLKGVKDYIDKQGVSWTNPHPSRLIIDNSAPMANINHDVGVKFIGYWDVVRYGQIANDPAYFNRSCITYGPGLWALYGAYTSYFTQYHCAITPPPSEQRAMGAPGTALDPAGSNDRKANIGVYNGEMDQMACFKCEYFRKLKPKDYRMGDYPFDVWIRFVVASDSTVIYAEPLPSSPAAYFGINESDSRQLNASFAHDVMWCQDMMSNLVTHMMLAVQGELLKVIGLNTDLMDAEDIKKLKARLAGSNYAAEGPIVIPFSLRELAQEMDLKTDALFKIGETRQGATVDIIFRAMTQLLALLERMTAMSPAEQGQPAPREISATEVTEMASTTQNVYSFISDGIDEGRAAKKRIIYESTVSCKEGDVQVPVVGRYSAKTIAAAGFKPVEGTNESGGLNQNPKTTVTGSTRALVHDLVFTSRDGSERPVNTQAANTLVQMLNVLVSVPGILQAMGRERLYDILNDIFRLSGTGVDLNLELQEGEQAGFGDDEMAQMQEVLKQLQQAMGQLVGMTQKNAQDLADQEQVNEQQQGILQGLASTVDIIKKSAEDINKLVGRVDKLENTTVPEISYRDAPEEIRRQIEKENGYVAPASATYLEMQLAKEKDTKKSVVAQV